MKKFFLLLLLTAAFSGCNGKGNYLQQGVSLVKQGTSFAEAAFDGAIKIGDSAINAGIAEFNKTSQISDSHTTSETIFTSCEDGEGNPVPCN